MDKDVKHRRHQNQAILFGTTPRSPLNKSLMPCNTGHRLWAVNILLLDMARLPAQTALYAEAVIMRSACSLVASTRSCGKCHFQNGNWEARHCCQPQYCQGHVKVKWRWLGVKRHLHKFWQWWCLTHGAAPYWIWTNSQHNSSLLVPTPPLGRGSSQIVKAWCYSCITSRSANRLCKHTPVQSLPPSYWDVHLIKFKYCQKGTQVQNATEQHQRLVSILEAQKCKDVNHIILVGLVGTIFKKHIQWLKLRDELRLENWKLEKLNTLYEKFSSTQTSKLNQKEARLTAAKCKHLREQVRTSGGSTH